MEEQTNAINPDIIDKQSFIFKLKISITLKGKKSIILILSVSAYFLTYSTPRFQHLLLLD